MPSSHRRSASVQRKAFSLIELLVVISIIAVLLALLLPALPRVMDAGRRTACAANLRGVGQAVELYKGDFKEIMPVGTYMPRPWLNFLNDDGSWPTSFNQSLDNYTRLNMQPVRIPIAHDFDGNTYETQDGRLVPVDFFHDTRNLLFGDGHVGKYDQDGPAQPGR